MNRNVDMGGLESSPEWERSMGLNPLKVHLREVHGRGHAVCNPFTGECEVHYDKVDPKRDFVGHLREDVPDWALALGAVGTVVGLSKLFGDD